MANTNILQFPGQAGQPPKAKPATDVSLQALQKKNPLGFNKSIEKAKEHSTDVMQGSDSTTQQILNRFSEQNAAAGSAKRGADAQRAELSGASQSTQNILGQLTNRDIEQQRQTGIAEMAQGLGQRADAQASQLSQIGQFEKQQALNEAQFKEQQEQFDITSAQTDTQLDQNQQKIDQAAEQWDKEFEHIKGVEKKSNLEKAYDQMVSQTDFTNAGEVEALQEWRKENDMSPLPYSKLKSDAFDAKEAKANAELINELTVSDTSGLYTGADGSTDVFKAYESSKVQSILKDLWQSEHNGLAGEFDPNNADHKKWALENMKVGLTSTTDANLINHNKTVADYKNSDEYLNLSDAEKIAADEIFADAKETLILGGTLEMDDDGNLTLITADGTVVGESKTIIDDYGSTYESKIPGVVQVVNEDGTQGAYTKNEDGEWIYHNGDKAPDHMNKFLENADGNSVETGLDGSAPEGYSDGMSYFDDGKAYTVFNGKLVPLNIGEMTDAQAKATLTESLKNPELAKHMYENGGYDKLASGSPAPGSGFMETGSNTYSAFKSGKAGDVWKTQGGVIVKLSENHRDGVKIVNVEIVYDPTGENQTGTKTVVTGNNMDGIIVGEGGDALQSDKINKEGISS